MAIPSLILALTFVAVFGPSIRNVIIAIGISYIPSQARIARSVALSLRETQYVDAARALGAPTWRILVFHIGPQMVSLYIIYLSLHLGGAIITESSLSFLGLGVPPDEPSWGGMITRGTQQALMGGIPWLALFPGLAIGAAVYGFNLLGDGLRDALDPRLRGSQGGRR
jgi:ABC-type dipeptide/oligopeptide/nickel transport system permease subunit